jgi:hypothetical protein
VADREFNFCLLLPGIYLLFLTDINEQTTNNPCDAPSILP